MRVDGFGRILSRLLLTQVVQDLTRQLHVVVSELANLSIVYTQDLRLLGSAEGEARNQVHEEEDQAGSAERVDAAGGGVCELVAELDPVVVEPAAGDHGEAI